jgi:hypothetical protein
VADAGALTAARIARMSAATSRRLAIAFAAVVLFEYENQKTVLRSHCRSCSNRNGRLNEMRGTAAPM